MKVIVAGGAGFIGAHLTRRLLARGDEVLVVDDFSTGRAANLSDVADAPGLAIREHNVIEPLVDRADLIFNLACPASPVSYQRAPIETIKTSVLGAVALLELADQTGARIVQASTSEVYGDPEMHPQTETYVGHVNPLGPRACYDEGKRCAETLFSDYRRARGVSVRIARIFNTYGPFMQPDDGRVVSNFIVQALKGAPLTLHGEGAQTRSFCYVGDTVEGLLRLSETPDEEWRPVNIGNPDEISVRHLAERVIALTGAKSDLIIHPRPEDDPQRRRPDISRAAAILGWRPETHLDKGLAATIDYFKSVQ